MNQHIGTIDEATRPFYHEDAPAIADLFLSVMRRSDQAGSGDLIAYLRHYYLDGGFADPDCPALVHVSGDGRVDGFGGRVTQRFTFRGRTLRAVIIGNLMVKDHARSPLAGARLMKALKNGPQDLTLSETAGDATLAMWRQLKGDVLERHSLDFIRVLKPARYALELLASRVGAANMLMPMSTIADRALAAKAGLLRWTGLPKDFKPEAGIRAQEIEPEDFAERFTEWTAPDAIVPVWSGNNLPAVVREAMSKRTYGAPYLRAAVTARGKGIGGFLFHFAGKGPARVTDIAHAPGQAGPVLDALFAEANSLGASCVIGRTTPQLFDALLSRRVLFAHMAASVIAAKDRDIVTAFMQGQVHFNGLVGERWTRLIGDRFDDLRPCDADTEAA